MENLILSIGKRVYYGVGFLVTFVTFIVSWICFVAAYDLLGALLGWFPSFLIGALVGTLWPLAFVVVLYLIF